MAAILSDDVTSCVIIWSRFHGQLPEIPELSRHWVEGRHCPEVSLVGGNNQAVIGLGDRGNHHVGTIERQAVIFAVHHQSSPDQGGSFVKWKDSASE